MKKEMKIGKEGYEVPSLTIVRLGNEKGNEDWKGRLRGSFSYNCPFGGYKRLYGQSYRYGKRRCFHQPSERRGDIGQQ